MCGIAGLISPILPEEARCRLGNMLERISYRGPDERSGTAGPGFALGMVRLSIVDLLTGIQPAVSDDGKIFVVFNGEIFNYQELREDLKAKGYQFRFGSEVEVLLHLYCEHGISMASKLNGQFAIAIWNARTNSLHLIRDPFGIRPLFWWSQDQEIIFASEVKAILANSHVEASFDPKALLQTLHFWTCIGSTSAFDGISQVPPGHCLTWRNGKTELDCYWQWSFSDSVTPLRLASDEEYFEAFREEMKRSVQRQSMSDVEVGAYLSGGIDSSVIVHNLHAINGERPLSTFSVAFDDPSYDESNAQQLVVDQYRTRHTITRVSPSDIAANFTKAVIHAEVPLFRSAPVPMYQLSRLVRQAGIKVVLSGEGADEVLLGYDLFREAKVRKFWATQPESSWRGHLIRRLYDYLPQYKNPRYANLLLDFYRPTLTQVNDPHYAMAVRWSNGGVLAQCLSENLKAGTAQYDPVADLNTWLPRGYTDTNVVERAQAIEVLTLMSNYLLSSQGDRMGMANSVEMRYPYLDLEFVRFAASLPQSIKLRGLKDKFILRNSYAGKMPGEISSRKKFAYQAPDKKAFFRDGALIDWAADLLTPERLRQDGLFDPDYVARYCLTPPTGDAGRQGFRSNMVFMVVLSTTLLVEHFVRSRTQLSDNTNVASYIKIIAPQ